MLAYRQFVTYRVLPSSTRLGKTDKIPVDASGRFVSAHEPQYWTDAATAQAQALALGADYGIGFVFTENDPYWFLDIDDCLIEEDGKPPRWSPLALALIAMFPGAYVEISPSGRGLHIYGTGKPPAHGCKNVSLGLEFYHAGRFGTVTGMGAQGSTEIDFTASLPLLVDNYFPLSGEMTPEDDGDWTLTPVEGWSGPTDDDELIRRAMNSQSAASAFSNKASFADLWLANEPALCLAWPDPLRGYDASHADAALAQHLAFWTGKNCERISTLMYRSKLVRDKWIDRADYYIPRTILRAVARQMDVLADRKPAPVAAVAPGASVTIPPPPVTSTDGFMGCEAQLQHFGGCVYIRGMHRAFMPGGILLKPEQFKVQYGGFQFNMDMRNDKLSKDAWEAWTTNQAYRPVTVDGVCFKPNLESGAIVHVSGQSFVNTYFPIMVPRKQGDATPFLQHLERVLPVHRDRTILLSYMAACVQYKGIKFQWAPLLQGVEGNGKTLFTRCVAEAIGRRYVHFPPANEISEKFNSWLFNTVFIGVEDIYVPNQKQEVFEILKPMITSDYLAKRAMQTDQIMAEVVANFIFNSNHKDGLKKTYNDRRICILFCDQQNKDDLQRDGMNGAYFSELYKWLRADGYAIVSEYLSTYAIPAEFNPAGECQKAPVTSTTQLAIEASAGNLEQEIEEAVAQGLQGFCGGWVSTIFLERLLEKLGLQHKVKRNQRREILEQMGYRYHPALADGRVNNIVMPDGGKPRLFIHKSSLALQISDAAAAAHNYQTANAARAAVQMPFTARG